MEFTKRYVSDFYDFLEQGKVVGQKCQDCHGYQLFLSPCCRHCQSTNVEYVEFSKEASLLYICITNFADDIYLNTDMYPLAFGAVQFPEGPVTYMPVIEGINLRQIEKENQRCPIPVEIDTMEFGGNVIPVAKVIKEQSES